MFIIMNSYLYDTKVQRCKALNAEYVYSNTKLVGLLQKVLNLLYAASTKRSNDSGFVEGSLVEMSYYGGAHSPMACDKKEKGFPVCCLDRRFWFITLARTPRVSK